MSRARISLGVVTGSLTESAGGMYFSIREPRLELAARGLDIVVYGTDDGSEFKPDAWAPLEAKAYPVQGPVRFGYSHARAKALLAGRHTVLHQHGLWTHASLLVRRWARRTGGCTVVSAHGMLDRWALNHRRWKKLAAFAAFERSNLAGATCLHALTEHEAAGFRSLGLTKPIAVIPNGVRLPPGREPDDVRQLSADGRKPILYLGRIHPKKGLTELISCWTAIKRRSPHVAESWILVIAGWDDGGHVRGLLQQVRDSGLENDVVFAGALYGDDKDAMLRKARAFILPSYSEGLPMGVLEAWAYGLPVFMTRACNLTEGFEAGAAFEIDTDPARMAATLARLLGDERTLASAGRRGRMLAERNFTWPSVAERFVLLYEWLLGGADRPAFVV